MHAIAARYFDRLSQPTPPAGGILRSLSPGSTQQTIEDCKDSFRSVRASDNTLQDRDSLAGSVSYHKPADERLGGKVAHEFAARYSGVENDGSMETVRSYPGNDEAPEFREITRTTLEEGRVEVAWILSDINGNVEYASRTVADLSQPEQSETRVWSARDFHSPDQGWNVV